MTDEEMQEAIRSIFDSRLNSLLESTQAMIEQIDRITAKVDRLNDRLEGHGFTPKIIK